MARNLADPGKPPLPMRNLCRLVAKLLEKAERRKQLGKSEQPRDGEVVRFKGKLPCEVSLAELTAEFMALSVVESCKSSVAEKRRNILDFGTWTPLTRESAKFQTMETSPRDNIICEHVLGPFSPCVPTSPVSQQPDLTGQRAMVPPAARGMPVTRPAAVETTRSHSPLQNTRMSWPVAASLNVGSVPYHLSWVKTSDGDLETPAKANWSELAAPSPAEQKQRQYPDLAGKVTGMLLEMDNAALLQLLKSQDLLQTKVEEAVEVLQHHLAREKKQDATPARRDTSTLVTQEISSAQASGQAYKHEVSAEQQEVVTEHLLATLPDNEQKQILGERLYPLVQRQYPDLAGKVTGMLLEIDNASLLQLLKSQDLLQTKVDEAVSVLQYHLAREKKQDATPARWNTLSLVTQEVSSEQASGQVHKMREVGAGQQETLTEPLLPTRQIKEQVQVVSERLIHEVQRMYPEVKVTEALATMQSGCAKVKGEGHIPRDTAVTQMSSKLIPERESHAQQAEVGSREEEVITGDALAAIPATQQKQFLGKRLYPLVQRLCPEADKVTGMLLALDNAELLHLLQSQQWLTVRVQQALTLLQAQQLKAKEDAAVKEGAPLQLAYVPVVQQLAMVPMLSPVQDPRQALYPLLLAQIESVCGDRTLALHLTGILMRQVYPVLLYILQSRDFLVIKVTEALSVLQGYQISGINLVQETAVVEPSRRLEGNRGQEALSRATLEAASSEHRSQKTDEDESLSAEQSYNSNIRKADDTSLPSSPQLQQPPGDNMQDDAVNLARELDATVGQGRQAHSSNQMFEQRTDNPEVERVGGELSDVSVFEQKQMLGDHLYPLVQRLCPELAGKVTGMLLEMKNSEILELLQTPPSLRARVQEAVTLLQAHRARDKATATAAAAAGGGDGGPVEDSARETARTATQISVLYPASTPVMQVPFSPALLLDPPLPDVKQLIGQHLLPLIEDMFRDRTLASAITEMLLKLDNSSLLQMLQSREFMRAKVMEAYNLLQAYQSCQIQSVLQQEEVVSTMADMSGEDTPARDTLKESSQEEQKHMLTEQLPHQVDKLAKHLPGMDNWELLRLQQSSEALEVKDIEAMTQTHQDNDCDYARTRVVTLAEKEREITTVASSGIYQQDAEDAEAGESPTGVCN